MKSFFHHYSLQFGIYNGFDLRDAYFSFVLDNKELYKSKVAFDIDIRNAVITLTEWDVFQLSLGNATLEGTKFLDWAFEDCKFAKDPMTNPLMVSSHSGSSDYLLPFKVLKDYKNFLPIS